MKTRITELLGIRYPIVEGGMQWVGLAGLAAAVSNAGALGMVTARTQPTPDALRAEIARAQALTDQPLGVNLTLTMLGAAVSYDEWIDAIVDSGIRIVETAGNNPSPVVDRLKRAGVIIIHKCTSVRHALAAERVGADVISIDGFEAAGHPGEDDTPALLVVPATRAAVKVPVIASGGIADGRGLAAALALGADGVNVGTRFMVTQESPIHADIKRALADSSILDTQLIKRSIKRTGRFWRNAVTEEIVALEKRLGDSATYDDLKHLISGPTGREALETGQIDHGLICASQVIGLFDDVPTCEEAVSRMVHGAEAQLKHALAMFQDQPALA
jgi:nitronate monooxygenase